MFRTLIIHKPIHLDICLSYIKSLTCIQNTHWSTILSWKTWFIADGGDANRIGDECSKDDIAISQGTTSPLFNGIPSYTVRILNECASDCYMCNIHVNCGWFSSARLVNPEIFQRIAYNDCLVNGGEPLGPGESIYFEYSNIMPYQLTVSSADCC